MKTVQQIAAEIAQELREHPERWTQGSFARDADERPCHSRTSVAVCWCILGHLSKREESKISIWRSFMERAAVSHIEKIADWNDAPGRTVADVIALCEKVAS